MKTLIVAALIALGTSATAQTMTTMPLGGGWSTTTITTPSGGMTTCTTMPMGGGWTTTNCN